MLYSPERAARIIYACAALQNIALDSGDRTLDELGGRVPPPEQPEEPGGGQALQPCNVLLRGRLQRRVRGVGRLPGYRGRILQVCGLSRFTGSRRLDYQTPASTTLPGPSSEPGPNIEAGSSSSCRKHHHYGPVVLYSITCVCAAHKIYVALLAAVPEQQLPDVAAAVEVATMPGVCVWGLITKEGLGPMVRIEGRFTFSSYCSILDDVMVPYLLDCPFPEGDYVFQHDNSPIHSSRKSAKDCRLAPATSAQQMFPELMALQEQTKTVRVHKENHAIRRALKRMDATSEEGVRQQQAIVEELHTIRA
ncbi:hypothetical protein HPB50_009172 [Hyalomma asiaticum]|uniref:Uncharacterized protein n=1 Tax=Hyalomma asiaticum TaxID=266040 RepID=A0ACB7SUZ7_HYAAI|nr:hypothetical protein HPB50_009172 [Hyalomma asiaticum]